MCSQFVVVTNCISFTMFTAPTEQTVGEGEDPAINGVTDKLEEHKLNGEAEPNNPSAGTWHKVFEKPVNVSSLGR